MSECLTVANTAADNFNRYGTKKSFMKGNAAQRLVIQGSSYA